MDSRGLILILVGIFTLSGPFFDWDWFMDSRKGWFFSKILGGRPRARIFYIVLGFVMLTWGSLILSGIA